MDDTIRDLYIRIEQLENKIENIEREKSSLVDKIVSLEMDFYSKVRSLEVEISNIKDEHNRTWRRNR